MTIDDLRRKARDAGRRYDHAAQTLRDEEGRLEALRARLATHQEGQAVVQAVAESVQTAAHDQISKVVSRCLKTVFGDDAFDFRINFERKRGKTDAQLQFVRNGKAVRPLLSSGGGQIDVAAFALRLAALMLSTPKRRRCLQADEPFGNVNGREYQDRVTRLVEVLAEELDFQFVFASDNWFKPGAVIDLTVTDRGSEPSPRTGT